MTKMRRKTALPDMKREGEGPKKFDLLHSERKEGRRNSRKKAQRDESPSQGRGMFILERARDLKLMRE